MDPRPGGPVAKHQPSPEGLGDGSPRLWSAGGAALPTFGVPRLWRSDDVAESMSQPSRAGLKFGGRPSGPWELPFLSRFPEKKRRPYLSRHAWQIWALRHVHFWRLLSNRSQGGFSSRKAALRCPSPYSLEVKCSREVFSRLRPSHRGSASVWPHPPAGPTWTSLPSERRSALHPSWPNWVGS
jgi:hypothetical protein